MMGSRFLVSMLRTLRPVTGRSVNHSGAAFSTSVQSCAHNLGDKASASKAFSPEDLQTFANVTGDTNPLHLDEDYAKQTRFSRPVVHGTLTLGFVAGVIANKLPGPGTILLSQEIEYPGALYVNEEVIAQVELVELKRRIAVLRLLCHTVDERVVLKGTVRVLVAKDAVESSQDEHEGGL